MPIKYVYVNGRKKKLQKNAYYHVPCAEFQPEGDNIPEIVTVLTIIPLSATVNEDSF